MRDRTRDYDYEKLIREEQEHYSEIPVTERLTEGGLNDTSAWHHYWERTGQRILSRFGDFGAFVCEHFTDLERPLKILSLGSGYCGQELLLADRIKRPFQITCTDINGELFEEARRRSKERGHDFRFEVADLNFLDIEPRAWDVIYAHASLHHVINVERLFAGVSQGLSGNGLFHVIEVLGRNRTLIWKENLQLANASLRLLPRQITRGRKIRVRPHTEGMEGVRQEEILPLLRENFTPRFEAHHGAFMRFVCTHRHLGPALDPTDLERRRWLDLLIDIDVSAVEHGLLRPLEIWGVFSPDCS